MKNNFKDDIEIAKLIGGEYLKFIEKEKHKKHVLNKGQYLKLQQIKNVLKDAGVKDIKIDAKPEEIHGGLTATFNVLNLSKDQIKALCYALINADALTIDQRTDDKVDLSCSVGNLYKSID